MLLWEVARIFCCKSGRNGYRWWGAYMREWMKVQSLGVVSWRRKEIFFLSRKWESEVKWMILISLLYDEKLSRVHERTSISKAVFGSFYLTKTFFFLFPSQPSIVTRVLLIRVEEEIYIYFYFFLIIFFKETKY